MVKVVFLPNFWDENPWICFFFDINYIFDKMRKVEKYIDFRVSLVHTDELASLDE